MFAIDNRSTIPPGSAVATTGRPTILFTCLSPGIVAVVAPRNSANHGSTGVLPLVLMQKPSKNQARRLCEVIKSWSLTRKAQLHDIADQSHWRGPPRRPPCSKQLSLAQRVVAQRFKREEGLCRGLDTGPGRYRQAIAACWRCSVRVSKQCHCGVGVINHWRWNTCLLAVFDRLFAREYSTYRAVQNTSLNVHKLGTILHTVQRQFQILIFPLFKLAFIPLLCNDDNSGSSQN